MKTILILILVSLSLCAIAQDYSKDTLYMKNGDTIPCKIISAEKFKVSYFLPSGACTEVKISDVNYYIQQNSKPKSVVLTNDNSNILYCGNYLKRASKRLLIGLTLNIAAGATALIGTQIADDYQPVLIVSGAISLAGIIIIIKGIIDIDTAGYMLNPNNSISLNASKNGLTLAYNF